MKTKAIIAGVDFQITDKTNRLEIGVKPHDWWFERGDGPEIIAFIQQWLDHDPEEELLNRIDDIRIEHSRRLTIMSRRESRDASTREIIAAVREHDAKYGRKG